MIAVHSVSKRYGAVVAVDDATFTVARGEFFSLLGPSGCGKTTLLRLLAGFEAADGGAILLEGADVSRVPPYRRNVNTVFQQYALFPHLTVADNVAFGPRAKGLGRTEIEERVARMLAVVRLDDLAGRRPHQLSGGQRQRVALARALVNMPSALLLDEPLSALDLKLRQAMQLELKRIQREVGITFVFVTHDQEEALTMSDRIAVMRGGRIEQVGTPQDVYDAPRTPFVAGFIGTANLLPASVEAVHGGAATVRVAGAVAPDVPVGGATFAAGDAALLLLRPERVTLHATRAPSGVALRATLAAKIFQGPVVRCILHGPDGVEIVALDAPGGEAAALEPGAALWLAFAPACARLLRP